MYLPLTKWTWTCFYDSDCDQLQQDICQRQPDHPSTLAAADNPLNNIYNMAGAHDRRKDYIIRSQRAYTCNDSKNLFENYNFMICRDGVSVCKCIYYWNVHASIRFFKSCAGSTLEPPIRNRKRLIYANRNNLLLHQDSHENRAPERNVQYKHDFVSPLNGKVHIIRTLPMFITCI